MHGKQDLLTYIRRTLSYLQTDVSNSNGLRLYDGNIAAEDFYCKLLNLIYASSFKTLNIENKNFPDVDLTSQNQLARIYIKIGKYEAAGLLLEKVIGTFKRNLGDEHPWVAIALVNMANTYLKREKYLEALSLFREAMRIWETELPLEHPDIAPALTGFKICKEMLGQK